MRNKKIIRLFTAMLAVVLCTTAFAVPASAGGGDGEPYYTETAEPEPTEEAEPTEETTGGMEPEGQPLTPEGNATLVDDFYGDKQLITVTTKAGNYNIASAIGRLLLSLFFGKRARTPWAVSSCG